MDKMEKYFEEMANKLKNDFHNWSLIDSDYGDLLNVTEGLKQIYLDGRRKQGEVDAEAVSELLVRADVDGDVIEHNMAINEALCALKSVQPKGQ